MTQRAESKRWPVEHPESLGADSKTKQTPKTESKVLRLRNITELGDKIHTFHSDLAILIKDQGRKDKEIKYFKLMLSAGTMQALHILSFKT